MNNERPPIGITPRNIWTEKVQQDRVSEILDAIDRYYRKGVEVPVDWIQELQELGALQHDKF